MDAFIYELLWILLGYYHYYYCLSNLTWPNLTHDPDVIVLLDNLTCDIDLSNRIGPINLINLIHLINDVVRFEKLGRPTIYG